MINNKKIVVALIVVSIYGGSAFAGYKYHIQKVTELDNINNQMLLLQNEKDEEYEEYKKESELKIQESNNKIEMLKSEINDLNKIIIDIKTQMGWSP